MLLEEKFSYFVLWCIYNHKIGKWWDIINYIFWWCTL